MKTAQDRLTEMVNARRIEEVDMEFDPRETALLSIAVSLKRIADALRYNKDDGEVSIYDLLNVIVDKP